MSLAGIIKTSRRRRKVLCLGVSYADVKGQLRCNDHKVATCDAFVEGTVGAAIACVESGILTQIDGRDLARCRSTELTCQVDIYTASQEKGAVYRSDRHVHANFNRHDFVRSLKDSFGSDCKFDEIVLDYFWIPSGWDAYHWDRSFFRLTLVNFVELELLKEGSGVIYLPFCLHCFKQVLAHFDELRKYYNVSFLCKGELETISLWKGTQEIDAMIMQKILGKHKSQEELYCTFGPRDVREAMDDPNTSKQEMIELARSLEDFEDIRFLRLEQLHPRFKMTRSLGSFLGRVDPRRVKQGFDQIVPATPVTTSSQKTGFGSRN